MVFRWLGLRTFEVWLTGRLLASPTFHRLVARVHQKVQHMKHGVPPEELSGRGTHADDHGSSLKQFFGYFKEEIKDQMKGKPPNKF
ncbi:hypothetical protein BDV25DRAFT_150667 [Aspergillus avenaceus]|uniref:Uncharacterized protein n=1 Tax=Aspergillus avenaceus TaxID=36643 RepID=A0A5N6U208_ASPAV|nr:hypothetical protein BDV25DRAFT_150667 [Aspergillus avenaceus]